MLPPEINNADIYHWPPEDSDEDPVVEQVEIFFGPNGLPPAFDFIINDHLTILVTLEHMKKLVAAAEAEVKKVEYSIEDAKIRQDIRRIMKENNNDENRASDQEYP